MKKGRGFNLTAGIMDIVVSVYYLIMGFIMCFASSFITALSQAIEETGGAGAEEVGAMIGTIIVLVGIMYLILAGLMLTFGILTIKVANGSEEEYYAKTGRLLGFSITLSVMLFLQIISIATTFNAMSLIALLIFAVIVVFHWVGFGLAKSGANAKDEPAVTIKLPKAEEKKVENGEVILDSDVAKLERIAKLKESGAISEEEYNNIKSKILK